MELVCRSVSAVPPNRSSTASTPHAPLAPPLLLPLAILLSPLILLGVLVLVATDAHRILHDQR